MKTGTLAICCIVVSFIPAVLCKNPIPPAMMGRWSSELMSATFIVGETNELQISTEDSSGDAYMSHLGGAQLFRVQGDKMQYCFKSEVDSEYGDKAPFYVVHSDNRSVTFCWRIERMQSHAAGCTGCDCAKLELRLDELGNLQSTFYMSPPGRRLRASFLTITFASSVYANNEWSLRQV